MESQLGNNLCEILNSYLLYKASERYYLFEMSKEFQLTQVNKTVKVKEPVLIKDAIKISSSEACLRPKSKHYLPTEINFMAIDKDELTYLPFDEHVNKVYIPPGLDGHYKSTPFNACDREDKIIENDQFLEFLTLSLYKDYHSSSNWLKLTTELAGLLNKDRRDMVTKMSKIIAKHSKTNIRCLKPSSYKENFCRICKTYSCLAHFSDRAITYEQDQSKHKHIKDEHDYKEKLFKQLDPENWKLKWWIREKSLKKSGKWLMSYKCPNLRRCGKERAKEFEATKIDKFIIKKFLSHGCDNPCALAFFLERTCQEAKFLINNYQNYFEEIPEIPKLPKKTYFTDKEEYNYLMINVVGLHCDCENGCTVENQCPCLIGEINENDQVINRKCCEKFCSCATSCAYRFLGCNCQNGKCNTKSCVCFANFRECDPDLCRSCCSAQSIKDRTFISLQAKNKSAVLCSNVKVQLKFQKRTALAPSALEGAGTGLIVLENVNADEFIIEYTGELITEAETNRRAAVYDYKQHSYIFSMSPDPAWSIDATFLGNKMRFVNHKSHDEDNCYTRVWRINGNSRILLFAREKISAGSELFFNYGYDTSTIKYGWYQQYEGKFKKKKIKN
ncbi:unnamed protein product [Blepharisma stoltei]|uniref:[Histone H3]-lysine(27) N-trimethyltransferase n=1 Tax=Blepharisma stoltei TaxID=1481888 RepID=A0AAU9JLP5_9CILI|nr:unnamed protein product [Blepharisma stoltei]